VDRRGFQQEGRGGQGARRSRARTRRVICKLTASVFRDSARSILSLLPSSPPPPFPPRRRRRRRRRRPPPFKFPGAPRRESSRLLRAPMKSAGRSTALYRYDARRDACTRVCAARCAAEAKHSAEHSPWHCCKNKRITNGLHARPASARVPVSFPDESAEPRSRISRFPRNGRATFATATPRRRKLTFDSRDRRHLDSSLARRRDLWTWESARAAFARSDNHPPAFPAKRKRTKEYGIASACQVSQ